MNILGQDWIETETHLVIELREPYWSAWKTYNWEKGVEGIGVSIGALAKAESLNKKIQVNVKKYGSYEISPSKCIEYKNNVFKARDNTVLIEIPRTAFEKLPEKGAV